MKDKIKFVVPVAFFAVFSVLFYGPLGVYLSNSQELWFSLGDVLGIATKVSLIGLVIILLIGLLLPSKFSTIFTKVIFGITLGLYIQGNFINIKYGSGVLDGTAINWSKYTGYAIVNSLVWIICLALPFVIELIPFIKKEKLGKKIVVGVSLAVIAMQLPAMITQLVQYTPNSQGDIQITKDGMFEYSADENVIVFLLDTFDEAYLEELIENYPEYKDTLADFVHYDNVLASAARTIVALPSIMSGKPYTRDQLYSDYITSIYKKDNMLKALDSTGADVRVYSESTYFSTDTAEWVDNFDDKKGETNYELLGQKMYKLVSFMYTPHLMKRYFEFNTAEFNDAKGNTTEDKENAYVVNDAKFIKKFRDEKLTISQDYKKAFRFYHFHGSHAPFNLDADGNSAKKSDRKQQTAGIFKLISEMLQDMKDKGVYDKATIIITADHGDKNYQERVGFLLKEAGHTGSFETNSAPVSLFDLPVYVCDVLGAKLKNQQYAMNLLELTDNTERERHFFQNTSGSSKLQIKEFTLSGRTDDPDAIKLLKVYEDSVKAENYKFDTVLSFAQDTTGNRYAVEGFSQNTGFRTVLVGNTAKLAIPLDKKGTYDDKILNLKVFYNESKPINMNLYVNEVKLFEGEVTKDWHQKYTTFAIPKEAFENDSKNINITLEFPDVEAETERTISLVELSIGKDVTKEDK